MNINYIFTFIFLHGLSKIRDLIEVVRPAGCGVQLVAAEIIDTIDGIEISDYIDPKIFPYDFTRYTVGKEDKVGFSEVTNHTEVDRTHNNKIENGENQLGGH